MVQVFRFSSLQQRITAAYGVLVAMAIALAVVAVSDLLFLERRVNEGRVVSLLRDGVLEMRREERHLLLYGDDKAFTRVVDHVRRGVALLGGETPLPRGLAESGIAAGMQVDLAAYLRLLERWQATPVARRQALDREIRDLGQALQQAAELLSEDEWEALEAAVRKSQWLLMLTLPLIGVAIYLVGRRLAQAVVAPLQQMESRLMPIAEGHFNQLQPPSGDREFIAFTRAFNRMLRELEVRQKRMTQNEKLAALGTLAAGVAHELNNPLCNISTACQLLLEELPRGEADPEMEQLRIWLTQIDGETERGRRIVRTLLEFGGQRVFRRQYCPLRRLVEETLVIIDKALREHHARLEVEIAPGLSLAVDKQRIQQLLINLVQNALQAGEPGIRLRIGARQGDPDGAPIPDGAAVAGNLECIAHRRGRFVELTVSDDGPGIGEDVLPKVFDPFYTTREPGRGTGLGLFIVQEIVREHEGCLAIFSSPGAGARVVILLPAREEDA